jgi:hypothetical protein
MSRRSIRRSRSPHRRSRRRIKGGKIFSFPITIDMHIDRLKHKNEIENVNNAYLYLKESISNFKPLNVVHDFVIDVKYDKGFISYTKRKVRAKNASFEVNGFEIKEGERGFFVDNTDLLLVNATLTFELDSDVPQFQKDYRNRNVDYYFRNDMSYVTEVFIKQLEKFIKQSNIRQYFKRLSTFIGVKNNPLSPTYD